MLKYLGSPWLSQIGVVPVNVPEVVQFLWADPDRVKPSWHEKLCVSPTRSHCLLGQKSPWSSCSWAGHKISEPFKKKSKTVDEMRCDVLGFLFFFFGMNVEFALLWPYFCRWPATQACDWLISLVTTRHQSHTACGWLDEGTDRVHSGRSAHFPAGPTERGTVAKINSNRLRVKSRLTSFTFPDLVHLAANNPPKVWWISLIKN